MSLLYHLLRANSLALQNSDDDDDDDIVPVASPNNTRPSSPALKGAAARKLLSRTDPLRTLPTNLSQCIFARLSLRDLAKCSLVSKKWNRSQTINYGTGTFSYIRADTDTDIVWFQHYRRENFHDASLPPGKWTRRESKQNWVCPRIQNPVSLSQH